MAERKTTSDELSRKAIYTKAGIIEGAAQPTEVSEAFHQRTVVTTLTHGTVNLRYAPRTPKATEPVDTAS